MSVFQTDVRDEIAALVASTLSVDESTIYNSITAARLNLLKKIKSGGIALPIYIVEAGEFNPDDEWGADSQSYRCPVQIIAVISSKVADAQAVAQTNLETVRQAIDAPGAPTTSFQSVEFGLITSGVTDDNLMALVQGQLDTVAATLTWKPGLLCGSNL